MMRSILDPRERAAIDARLSRLTPDTARRWGRMTAPQMVCHLTDALRGVLGERGGRTSDHKASIMGRTLVKWVGLYSPLPWPHGLRTPASADQERGGTAPAEFKRDVIEFHAATDRFLRDLPAIATRPHFVFGPLTEAEWAGWAYRHADHHLRQFGL